MSSLTCVDGLRVLPMGNARGAVSPTSILDTIRDVLGITGALLDAFAFVNSITTNGLVELLHVTKFIDHAASSGIIGAATGGDFWDHPEFNLDQFDKLLSCSSDDETFTAQDWGSCVNLFAGERYEQNNFASLEMEDVNWLTANPFSWVVLTAEYANVFTIFKDSDNTLSVDTATSLWRDAKMPEGWESPKRTADSETVELTVQSMGVDIDGDAVRVMNDADLSIWQDTYDFAVSICGASWVHCQQSMVGRRLLIKADYNKLNNAGD